MYKSTIFFIRTFVSLDEIAVTAQFRNRCVPADAQLVALDVRDSDVADQTRNTGFRRHRYIDKLRASSQGRYPVLGEYLEAIGSHCVQAGYRDFRVVEYFL